VEALGGRLDLVAYFGDMTVRLPVSDTNAAGIIYVSSSAGVRQESPQLRLPVRADRDGGKH